jgi:hypothetical protein
MIRNIATPDIVYVDMEDHDIDVTVFDIDRISTSR